MEKKRNNPPKASIKRNTFFDEEIFGTAYDQKIVKRFGKYLKPFKKQIIYAIIAVIFFSISSVLLPLIVKYTIDSALIENNTVDKIFVFCIAAFFVGILINFISGYLQEMIIGKVGEKVLIDLGNCIKSLKSDHGYEKIVLGGWSGGGSLSLFYQSEAENPSITETPAGDAINLIDEQFIPADGVMLIAAHESRHRTFTEWIDGSVVNEVEPENRDVELDIYNPENPNQPTYSQEFIETYRKAQIERNRKITSWVQEKLADFRKSKGIYFQFLETISAKSTTR